MPSVSVRTSNPAEVFACGEELSGCGEASLVWGVAIWTVRNIVEANRVSIVRRLAVLENMLLAPGIIGFTCKSLLRELTGLYINGGPDLWWTGDPAAPVGSFDREEIREYTARQEVWTE